MNTWLNLKDNVIIVTGGASGIGLAIVDELLSQGAHVQMIDIHGGDRHHNGDNYHFWPTDISSATEVQQTIDAIIQRWSRIDGLVNNAGVNFPRLLVDEKAPAGRYELNEAAFEKMVNINQKGVFFMSQAVARQMVKQRAGVIVNVSSESGLEGSEGQSCYAATKAALNSFTRSWSKELGKYGIRVVGVAPGILEKTGLRTPEYEEALAWTRNITVEQLREGYTKTPFPSGGQESSRKWLILFAISCQRAPATSPESPLTLPAEKRAVKEAVWFTLSSAPTASWPGPCLIRYAWSTARLTSAPSRLSPAKTRRISPLTWKS